MIAIGAGDLLTDPQVMTHPYAPDFFLLLKINFRDSNLG